MSVFFLPVCTKGKQTSLKEVNLIIQIDICLKCNRKRYSALRMTRVTFPERNMFIYIEANKKIVYFLDVTLNLVTYKYKPYSKPNNIPFYVHRKSNQPPTHTPSILRNIPLSRNERSSEISSDEQSLKQATPLTSKP